MYILTPDNTINAASAEELLKIAVRQQGPFADGQKYTALQFRSNSIVNFAVNRSR